MYELMVRRDFIAQHFLTVPDCGPENELHSHHYALEIRLEGDSLNDNGYLVDITDVEAVLDRLVERCRDASLNELPEFEGLNPSVEHFARILGQKVDAAINAPHVDTCSVRVWEDEDAWASYHVNNRA